MKRKINGQFAKVSTWKLVRTIKHLWFYRITYIYAGACTTFVFLMGAMMWFGQGKTVDDLLPTMFKVVDAQQTYTATEVKPFETEKDMREAEIQAIKSNSSIDKQAYNEAAKQYWTTQMKEAKDELLKLQNQGFKSQSKEVTALKNYLSKFNPGLVAYAQEIVKLPRYVEVVAIATQETQLCTVGVGASRNNCGGVKGKSGFKVYENAYESLSDIARIVSTKYHGDSIDDMNGHYCVDETTSKGGPCVEWARNINKNIEKLLLQ